VGAGVSAGMEGWGGEWLPPRLRQQESRGMFKVGLSRIG
jgi:hypothetical protein